MFFFYYRERKCKRKPYVIIYMGGIYELKLQKLKYLITFFLLLSKTKTNSTKSHEFVAVDNSAFTNV